MVNKPNIFTFNPSLLSIVIISSRPISSYTVQFTLREGYSGSISYRQVPGSMADLGEAPTLFLVQIDAPRAKKNYFRERAPLFRGLDDRGPHLSEGLDPPLRATEVD